MAVSDIPTPRSYPQILGEMLNAVTSNLGINRLKRGNPILSALEAAARSDYRNTNDTFDILKSIDLDNSEGIALDRIGRDERVPRLRLAKSSGLVDFSDTSFNRISSSVFQGTSAPIVGSTSINVVNASDAAGWPTSGTVYVGRGTNNVEGPLTYTGKVNNGSYWTLTLSTPTTRFHNNGEDVVLGQGGIRNINAGTTVATSQGTLTAAVQFTTLEEAIIPDGEVEVVGVPVIASTAGAQGNVPAVSINSFIGGEPFIGAAVTNTKPYVTGRDQEKDKDYRNRIRVVRNSRQRGTDLAIEQAMLNVVSPDQSRQVSSASVVRYKDLADKLFVDDGSGLEEESEGTGLEILVDSAVGGEFQVETIGKPIALGFVEPQNSAPYILSDGAKLAVLVGGVLSTHTFDADTFNSIGSASAYEVVSSINSNPDLLFSARTTESATKFAIFSRSETNDDIQVTSVDTGDIESNTAFLLPTNRTYTTMLYKNDRLLSKDGVSAKLQTQSFEVWNSFSGVQTLEISVDNTPTALYAFTDQDFINYNTGYTTLGKNSLEAWATVLNSRIPGITATVENDKITIVSNRGNSSSAGLQITDGSLVGNLMWELRTSNGADKDYSVQRGTGQISLTTPLSAGDRLTLGSKWTRSFLESPSIAKTNLASDATLWFAVDSDPTVVTQGVGSATELTASVERVVDHGFHLAVESTNTVNDVFENVQQGDWLVMFDSDTDLPTALRNAWRVVETETNKVIVEKTTALAPRGEGVAVALDTLTANAGLVLVCGGYSRHEGFDFSINGGARSGRGVMAFCEIFDPNTGLWSEAAPMSIPRFAHTATKMNDGRVLVTGGIDAEGNYLDTAEIYDPVADTWTSAGTMSSPRAWHTASLLSTGDVLVAGGYDGTSGLSSSEEYDTGGGTWGVVRAIGGIHYGHAVVVGSVNSGPAGAYANNVFILGGYTGFFTRTTTVHRYDPVGQTWSPMAPMATDRANMGAAIVDDPVAADYIIVMGGDELSAGSTTYDVLDLTTNTWAGELTIPNSVQWRYKDLIRVNSTEVLALYGTDGDQVVHTSIGWSGAAPTFTLLPASKYEGGIEKVNVEFVLTDNANKVVAVNGVNRFNLNFGDVTVGNTVAHHEVYDDDTNTWLHPDPADELNVDTLSNKGIAVLRTLEYLQKATIPTGNNYTAPTFASALNDDLLGAQAVVYRTNKVRVRTNSFDNEGDIVLVGEDSTTLGLASGEVSENLVGHLASVETQNSGLGTPVNFQIFHNLFTQTAVNIDSVRTVNVAEPGEAQALPPFASGSVVALKRWGDGLNPKFWEANFTPGAPNAADEKRLPEYGNSKSFWGTISTLDNFASDGSGVTNLSQLGLRQDPFNQIGPHQPVYVSSHFAITPEDTLNVVVDNDTTTKSFSVPMWRQVTPTSTVYGAQNALRDSLTSSTLSSSFGLDYDFDDFAVFMQSRVKSHSADNDKRTLWRFARHGSEGDFFVVRHTYPAAADSSVAVSVISDQSLSLTETGIITETGVEKASIHIALGSGAARESGLIRSTTRMGFARVNGSLNTDVWDAYLFTGFEVLEHQRIAANGAIGNRLRIQVPNVPASGLIDSGIQTGDVLWFEATNSDPATLFSGAFTVTQVDAMNVGTGEQDIYFDVNSLGDGTDSGPNASPGTVSTDSDGEAYFDPNTAVGDYVRVNGMTETEPATFNDTTMRVVSSGRQYIQARSLDYTESGALTTPEYNTLLSTNRFAHFQGSTDTAQQVADAVNALAAVDNSTVPLTGTVIGTGTGVIDRATWDELDNASANYAMSDGLNYVQRTIDPANTLIDTELLFRNDITADLAIDSDWINEDVRLVPVKTKSIVNWLNTLAVTGLSSVAEVSASDGGKRIQISSLTIGKEGSVEVQGGNANSATATVTGTAALIDRDVGQDDTALVTVTSTAEAFTGDNWVKFENTNKLPKTSFIVPDTTNVTSIASDGTWTFDTAPYSVIQEMTEARIEIEKIGEFVGIHIPSTMNNQLLNSTINEHDYVYLTALPPNTKNTVLDDIATANSGTFRVIRSITTNFGRTIWIKNDNAVAQVCSCKIKHLGSETPVVNDEWVVSSEAFGADNKKTWIIESVGEDSDELYNGPLTIKMTESAKTVTSSVLVTTAISDKIQIRQGTTTKLYKKILAISPNQSDGSMADIQIDNNVAYGQISAAAGTIMSAMDKLDFPLTISNGVDGYRNNTGLIQEVNRTLYGDKSDEATYPGYAANGADILISGPLVKRIRLALSLRVVSGLETEDLADRVRSTVASVINQTGIGEPIAISDIVSAATSVSGIIAVAVVTPIYNSTNDIIPLQAFEKALVQDLKRDISISFVGE